MDKKEPFDEYVVFFPLDIFTGTSRMISDEYLVIFPCTLLSLGQGKQ